MQDFLVVLNAIFYITLTLVLYGRKKYHIDEGVFLVGVYALTALCCLYCYRTDLILNSWSFNLSGFVYLFVSVLIMARPALNKKANYLYNKLSIVSNTKGFTVLKYLSYVYVLLSFVSVYYSSSDMLAGIGSDVWNEIYLDSDKYEEIYKNALDGIAKRFTDYFRPVVLMFCFYSMTSNKINLYENYFILFATILSSLAISMMTASRGNVVNVIFLVIICYLIFKKGIPHKIKRHIRFISIIAIVIISAFLFAVTQSRFGDSAIDSILYYMGHSMLAFDYGVYPCLEKYSSGTYLFNYFTELLGIDSIPHKGMKLYTGEFITVVGVFFKDFGPVLTLIFLFILSSLVNKLIIRNRIDLADVFIYIFYISRVSYGITTVSSSEGFLWAVSLLIYMILKFLFRIKISK